MRGTQRVYGATTDEAQPVESPYIYIALKRRNGAIVHDEVLCLKHYEEWRELGVYDGRLMNRGEWNEIRPWNSEPRCSVCEDESLGTSPIPNRAGRAS